MSDRTPVMAHTAQEWEAMAAECSRRSAESFERSDTDGFLSQWASDSTAQVYRAKARIAENGGKAHFTALFTADGEHIAEARYVETRYGWTWVYDTETGPVWFRESRAMDEARAEATNRKKGYYVGTIMAPADCTYGSGNGVTVGVRTYRTTKGAEGVEIIDNGQ